MFLHSDSESGSIWAFVRECKHSGVGLSSHLAQPCPCTSPGTPGVQQPCKWVQQQGSSHGPGERICQPCNHFFPLCWLKNKAKRTDARLQRFSNSLQHIEEATQNASQNYIVLFYSRYVILWYIKYIYKFFFFFWIYNSLLILKRLFKLKV